MEFFVNNFQAFFLILVRINAMIMIAPFFSSGVIPFRIKAMLSFFITLIIFPVVVQTINIPASMGLYYLLVLQEVMIGIFIGFLISVIFSAFQLSAQYYAAQIGFGINDVLDPVGQISVPLIGQLKNFIGLMVFITMEGHHFLIEAIYKSFEFAPLFGVSKSAAGGFLKYLAYSFSGMFIIALKISLPIIATALLITMSMGILAKAAPQMNIMMFGFPIQIIVGFAMLMITSPLIIRVMHVALERSFKFLNGILLHWPA
jgi:flagellar biosynthetic protein FliR